MLIFRHVLLAAAAGVFLLTCLVSGAVQPSPEWRQYLHASDAGRDAVADDTLSVPSDNDQLFSSLLTRASPEALHDLLHKLLPKRYQHGIWATDRDAVEAVRRDDAPLATVLVQLAKRQADGTGNNSTTSSTTSTTASTTQSPTTTTNIPTTTTTTPTTTTTTTTTTTPPTTSTTTPTTTTTTTPPTTTSTPSTTTPSTTSTTSKSSTTPPPTTTSSSSPSSTSSPTSSSTTSSSTESTTMSTTTKPTTTHNTVRSTVISTYTSTLPGGDVSVVTLTSYIYAEPVQTSTQPSGSLQTNAAVVARQPRDGMLEIVAAAGVIGAMLW